MRYEILWCEVKKAGETNGRPWKITNMSLKDEAGNTIDDVSTFDVVTPGITIEGTIEMKGQYKNFKSAPSGSKSGFKGNQMAVVKKTQEGVKVAQQNKDLSIKMSSTMRMAVDLAIASKPIYPADSGIVMAEISTEEIKKWRKWLWLEWDKNDTDFPPS